MHTHRARRSAMAAWLAAAALLCLLWAGALAQPATYWCPMHADVRGQAGDRCRLCGMALVPQPPVSDPYWIDITRDVRPPRAGVPSLLRFVVRHPKSGAATTSFAELHERILHLFVVSHDLEYFAHVHPAQRADGRFEQMLDLPRPGAYRLIADFVPSGAATQLVQKTIVTAGFRGSLVPAGTLGADLSDKIVEGVRITPALPEPVAGREQLITFELEDAVSGRPIDDLEPYLGATGHLLFVGADLQTAAHSHPVVEISNGAGPRVVFQVVFPRAGDYRMWVQVQRRGRVLTAPFSVRARPRESPPPR